MKWNFKFRALRQRHAGEITHREITDPERGAYLYCIQAFYKLTNSSAYLELIHLQQTQAGHSTSEVSLPTGQGSKFYVGHMARCRAMLCKRGLCRHAASVCPSVRLSDTFVNSIETNKHIFKDFHHLVATSFCFFHTKRHGNISTGTPLTRASNAGGVGKNRDCDE